MKGFTLLELLVALSFFMVLLLGGYEAFDRQQQLMLRMEEIIRPEEESNYRLLILKASFEDSTRPLKKDLWLQEAPAFFQDLHYGQSPTPAELSIACPVSDPVPFEREGNLLRLLKTISIARGMVVLLAGIHPDGIYDWNYGRINRIVPTGGETKIEVRLFLPKPLLDAGSLCVVEMHGFGYSNGKLNWIYPSGQSAPFLSLDWFEAIADGRNIKIQWQKENIQAALRIQP